MATRWPRPTPPSGTGAMIVQRPPVAPILFWGCLRSSGREAPGHESVTRETSSRDPWCICLAAPERGSGTFLPGSSPDCPAFPVFQSQRPVGRVGSGKKGRNRSSAPDTNSIPEERGQTSFAGNTTLGRTGPLSRRKQPDPFPATLSTQRTTGYAHTLFDAGWGTK